jgi:hypothetical protein
MALIRWRAWHRATTLHALLVRRHGRHAVCELQEQQSACCQHQEYSLASHSALTLGVLDARVKDSMLSTSASANKSECHVGVMRIVMNRGKWQQKLKREGESELSPFDQNLLIPLDLSRSGKL